MLHSENVLVVSAQEKGLNTGAVNMLGLCGSSYVSYLQTTFGDGFDLWDGLWKVVLLAGATGHLQVQYCNAMLLQNRNIKRSLIVPIISHKRMHTTAE